MLAKRGTYLEYVSGEEDELRGTERKHALVTGNFGRCSTGNEPFTTDLHEDWGQLRLRTVDKIEHTKDDIKRDED
jgi:hypothetical protein